MSIAGGKARGDGRARRHAGGKHGGRMQSSTEKFLCHR